MSYVQAFVSGIREGFSGLAAGVAALLLLAMFIISKYELTDEVIDDINKKIEARN